MSADFGGASYGTSVQAAGAHLCTQATHPYSFRPAAVRETPARAGARQRSLLGALRVPIWSTAWVHFEPNSAFTCVSMPVDCAGPR